MLNLLCPAAASLLASIFAIGQRRLRNIIFFTALAHASLIAVTFSINLKIGASYLLATVFSLAAMWYISACLKSATGSDSIDDLGGLYESFPASTWAFITAAIMLSMFPPFPPFLAEHLAVEAAAVEPAALLLLVLSRIMLLACLFNAAHRIFFGKAKQLLDARENLRTAIPPVVFLFLSIISEFILYGWV